MNKRKEGYIYECNLPFSEIVKLSIDDCLNRIDRNKASLIIIDGLMGEGKTTLAVEIAQYVQKKYNNDNGPFYNQLYIEFEKVLGMGGKSFQKKLSYAVENEKENIKTVIYDEAGDFSRRGAITQFNKELIEVFQTFRTFKILVILCLPCVDILENNLFKEGVPKLLLNCHSRTNYGNIRGYGYEEMLWLRYYMTKEVVPLKAYKKVNPNFRGQFLDLPPEISEKLDTYSKDYKRKKLKKNVIKQDNLISIDDISKKIGKSYQMTRLNLKKLNIKAELKDNRKEYYNLSCLNKLKEA